ncbi:Quinone-oxidoreductase-like protein [Thalictrum thalictroides]|uniref:Quinone-oxidoreductase-like protein n=1 Tax=Thalictrum thalictroides TaxID=46969 RepID=A0A7J6WQG6_THATH|nr:Quinone-oxidoreductase-like protein [Thalictrum thalictroides]
MAKQLMHVVHYDSYGGGAAGLKHVEVPIPHPSKKEVLVKVEASSLNQGDWKIQKGLARPILPPKFPYVPVLDIAGEVVEIGQGVKSFKVGDKVVAILTPPTGGGLAEYAVAQVSMTVKRPSEVSAAEASGLIGCGLAAHQALTKSAGISLDSTGKLSNILITAASGGVGHYAIQLAKLGNAHVTVTCGQRNVDFVKSLGADEVLDYKTPDGASLISPSGKKYDTVIHCATDIPWSIFEPNLSERAKVINLNPPISAVMTSAFKKLSFSKQQMVPFVLNPKPENLEFLLGLLKEGKLKTVVDSTYPLSKAEDAWSKSMDGHATGKIIIEP